VETYQFRKEKERYSRKVSMEEIEKNGYNLNISRYVSTAEDEIQIDLNAVNETLTSINERIETKTREHNEFLKELGLPLI
jgi:type I restriction enzyme M protein